MEAALLTDEERQQAVALAWQVGRLNYRRRRTQLYLQYRTEQAKKVTRKPYWECTRRLGKSSELLAMFVEHCIQNQAWRAGFFAPVKDGLKDYIDPIIEKTLADCPAAERPVYHESRFMLQFKNGSCIIFRASNNKQHRVRRGQEFNEVGVDEARDVDDLDELIDSVLMPALFNHGGYCYVSSTPADTRSHPLFRYRQQAEACGALVRLTIWDANRLDPLVYPLDRIQEWKRETLQSVDGESKWKREFECEWVVNASRAAVPEWSSNYIQEPARDPYYPFYQHYIAIDWGYKDFTAIGFGTYLYRQAKLVQEAELAFSGKEVRSDLLASAIESQARKLWGPEWTARQVADCADPIATNEINKYPNMSFVPVEKAHTLDAMLNEFRCLVAAGRYLVSPRCPLTLHCLANAVWDEKRTKLDQDVFARHFDHLMQAVYMTRILDVVSNPIPMDFMIDGTRVIDLDFDRKDRQSQAAETLGQAFMGTRRRF